MNNKKKRLIYIDILRVLAMFPVITCHYTRSLETMGVGFVNKIMPDTFFDVYLGSFGVAIFFVLSGASLMYTYSGELDLKLYFKKRFMGIFPMFWIAWFIAAMYYFWKNVGFSYGVPKWKIILTVLGMDGYLNWYGPNFYLLGEWFLGCLLFLYMLFPIVKMGVEKKPILTGIVIFVIYILSICLHRTPMPTDLFFLVRLPEFAFGMYFVKYVKNIKWQVGVLTIAFLVSTWFVDYSSLICKEFAHTCVGITFVVAITWLEPWIKKLPLLIKICQFMGKYSYAVFLVHHVLIMELAAHFNGKVFSKSENYTFYIMYIILTFMLAWILQVLNKKVIALWNKEVVQTRS
ncbi:Peptidoglycan/LPS O-acetylase OafA/YrhL, contains acyltransferase and SGNH-hydrolase domains [Lachnospiraceae bacterium A10]|nr:Peptidoglycan/LPS O-acetylase OafA/YrhL, contains acyltransferase and SGNH-hydrolase domains [Lachnospiraceae bacterium A10]